MKVKTPRLYAIGAVALSSMLFLSACAQADDSKKSDGSKESDSASITVWVDAERVDALSDAAKNYEEESGVKVKLVSRNVEDIQNDFVEQSPSGKGPDIVMGAHDWAGNLVKNGVIVPIELGDKAAELSDIALQAATYNGKVYQLPYAVENLAILRNSDLAQSTPATWDEMIATGKAAGKKYPFVVEQGDKGNPYHLFPFQGSFGSEIFGKTASGDYDPDNLTIGDEKGVEFAKWLSKVGSEKLITPDITADIAKQAFIDGEAPYWLTGPWNVNAAIEAGVKVVVDPIPSAGSQPAKPFAGVKGFYLSAYSKNTVAANDFLVNYIATEEVQTDLFEAGKILPANKAAAEKATSDPIVAGFSAAAANATPMPNIPAMGEVWSNWGIAEVEIETGAEPVARWAKLAEDTKKAIADSQ